MNVKENVMLTSCLTLPQPSFVCERDDCAKAFRLKAHLERHMKTPHVRATKSRQAYMCHFCRKECRTRFDLRLHEAVHTGNKPLKCGVCDAAFAKKSRLSQHMKTHHVYSCAHPGCQFEADKWSLLRKHLPVHNVKCPHCSCRFRRPTSLDKHVATHQTTFPCSQCDMQYAKRSGLASHVRAVHDKVTFKCSIDGCDKEFSFKKSLRQHTRWHLQSPDHGQTKGPGITVKRTLTAASLSGHDASAEERKALLMQDKDFRVTQDLAV